MNGKIYPNGTVFQLLLSGHAAASVINEWWEASTQADVRIRKAKTRGHVVIETTEVIFAGHVIRLWPNVKVHVKEPGAAAPPQHS